MDAISRLLRMARLGASISHRCRLGSATRMDVAPSPALEAAFHVLLDGECQLQVGATLLELRAGDVVLITSGEPHRVITPGKGRLQGTVDVIGDAFVTKRSKGDPVVDLFCGTYTYDAGAGAVLFRSLPSPVHVSFGQSEVLPMLSALMRGEAEREGDGTAAIMAALCTVLLAMVLRSSQTALWTAPSDPRIAAAIEGVLREPGADWSIDRLSRAAAMSRATFLRHFGQQTGMTVGAFLARARVMAAADLLHTSDATVATIAAQVGYQSESAFSRAFRAEVGTTPARFRRSVTDPGGAAASRTRYAPA